MRCIRLLAAVVPVVLSLVASPARAADPVRLDAGWRFIKGDPAGAQAAGFDAAGWEAVRVPHSWNATDWQSRAYYRGPGWYRRPLDVPAAWKGQRIFVRFEAASIAAEVFVNGEKVGEHVGAFAAFCLEITRAVRPGAPNVLAVRVDNAPRQDVAPLSGDFNMFGGLYRPVTLFARNPVCVTPLDAGGPGVAIRQVRVSDQRADIEVTAKISNATRARQTVNLIVSVVDAAGKRVASGRRRVTVPAGETIAALHPLSIARPHLWNGLRDPYLHTLTVELRGGRGVDRITQPLGLRSFRFDPAQGFFLNGRPYSLHGVNRHQDREGVAWAVSETDQDEDMAIVRELGATTIRLAHYQHSDYFYSLCDRVGLVAWAEIPLVNSVNAGEAFAASTRQQLTELIRQNINHPSILVWSLYNEVGLRKGADPVPLIRSLQALAKAEDSTRPTVAATAAGEFAKLHEMVATPDLMAANLYPGWYSASEADMGPWIDERNDGYGKKGMAVSEYGAGASIAQHEQGMVKRPEARGRWHPEEWQAVLHERAYAAMRARPFVWGTFAWVMFDFASAGRTEGDRDGVNDKGLVTYDRKTKKDAFFFYKANWNPEPMVYITSRRDVERTQATTAVKVYSNCPAVELTVNGKSFGAATGNDLHVFVWNNVDLQPGENRIEVAGQCRPKQVTDTCRWNFTPVAAKPAGAIHPRLLFDAAEVSAIRERASKPALAPVAARLFARANALLTAAPLLVSTTARGAPDPPGHLKGLEAARRLQGRVLTYAMAYLLGGDRRYVGAAVRELDHAIEQWPAWVDTAHAPPYDLMTGELCLTYGLAYDWLYDALSPAERGRLREGLERRGLRPYLEAVDRPKPMSWYTRSNNWNTVCNGGAAVAALAVRDESAIGNRVVSLAAPGMTVYWDYLGADGASEEGTGYWTYGLRYAFMAADALRRAGIAEGRAFLARDGARRTGYFPLVFNPGTTLSASFGDSPSRAADPLFYFLAREYRNGDFAWFQDRAAPRPLTREGWPEEALALAWRPVGEPWLPESIEGFAPRIPPTASFPSIGWALFAPSQPDPPFFLAFKNGSLAASHTHLDLNHVSVGIGDTMLLVDLGSRPYPADYFSAARNDYYEISTAGHNTVLIDGKGQRPKATGTLRGPLEGPNYTAFTGLADGAYETATSRVRRHVVFVDRRYFVLLDELEMPAPASIELRFHTYGSAVARSGGGWTVSQGGASVDVVPAEPSLVDATTATPAGWIRPVTALSLKTRQMASRLLLATVIVPRPAGRGTVPTIAQRRTADHLIVSVGGDQLVFEQRGDGFQIATVTLARAGSTATRDEED